MKRPRISTSAKLAALAAAAVVSAMAVATLAFNLYIGGEFKLDATKSIEESVSWNEGDAYASRAAQAVPIRADGSLYYEQSWYSDEELLLIERYAKSADKNVAERVDLNNFSCYAMVTESVPHGWTSFLYETNWWGNLDSGIRETRQVNYLVYVDVTSEVALVRTINTVFACIAVAGALIAGALAYKAGRRIEEAQATQTRFYENMSHELKTPLAAISGYAEGIGTGVVSASRASVVITSEVERMRTQIDEILSISRLEAGAVELAREDIEVADFVQDCLMPFEGVVRTRGLDVKLDLAPGSISADPDRLGHAFTNVLTNAFRHADHVVSISFDGTALRVWNDGDVPSTDEIAHLFDRFYTSSTGGTGIGLALAREIVELHGGKTSARLVDGGLEVAFVW